MRQEEEEIEQQKWGQPFNIDIPQNRNASLDQMPGEM